MKKEVTAEGATVEEAIDAALEELGVQQDVVDYEVTGEPGKRLFGGEKRAQVRVWLKKEFLEELEHTDAEGEREVPPAAADDSPETDEDGGEEARPSEEELDEIADVGIAAVRGILEHLGVDAEIEEYEGDEGEIILDIVGADLGILIGRHGRTLDSMQTVVTVMARQQLGRHYPILVDVEGYRSRRKAKLEEIAQRAAEKVTRQGRSVRLRPMNAYERKVVHVTLRDDGRVSTLSEGEDPYRQVVVSPE